MRLKCRAGLSLIELVITFSLLSLVLILGYNFYTFATTSFTRTERQSTLQQAVSLAADQISDQLRSATEITIIQNSAVPPIGVGQLYLFQNPNSLELMQQNSSRVLVDAARLGMRFDSLTFTRTTPTTLSFTIIGSRLEDRTRTYSITSQLFMANLPLAGRTITVTPGTTGTTGPAVLFMRQP